jgi:hypothetical protein
MAIVENTEGSERREEVRSMGHVPYLFYWVKREDRQGRK